MPRPFRLRARGDLSEDARLIEALLFLYPATLLAFGLAIEGFDLGAVARGLAVIVREPDTLINDYVAHAGLGAPFVNAGLCSLAAFALIRALGAVVSGPAIAAVLTIAGFALFGKNVYNIWPGMIGIWLFSRLVRRPFAEFLIVALFGTALSPLVSEVTFGLGLPPALGLVLGPAAGMLAGFCLPSLAKHLLQLHQGYNLYNIGLTAGLVGTAVMSLFRAFGIKVDGGGAWSTGNREVYLPFLLGLFGSMIAFGLAMGPSIRSGLRGILSSSGRLVSDFVRSYGIGPTLVNMGLVGLVGSAYILAVGGDWNGPTIGGLFTMVGFAAFGKHPLNIAPVMAGVAATALVSTYSPAAQGPILAALFGTTLAPLAGRFGPLAGFAAGALHLTVVSNVGYLHGGLNLYNNGFSGGLVAAILVPLFEALRERRRHGR
ncbi:MAG TPA: DUF1576 domain-containing protein [Spirochaetales bacterium]|nr:DUF1576 domain-containing protein [Spirochaetales bacterium]HRY55180.1 DUF1576 domain-containing protein [Spirochaetia bacterium]HRZ63587.1 DUF1576 domain-containing protein [Spirochaetia bacterium]